MVVTVELKDEQFIVFEDAKQCSEGILDMLRIKDKYGKVYLYPREDVKVATVLED